SRRRGVCGDARTGDELGGVVLVGLDRVGAHGAASRRAAVGGEPHRRGCRRGFAMSAVEPGLLSAVIVNYEGGDHLLGCLEALLDEPVPVQAIIVDNGSGDGSTAAATERFPDVEVVRP